MPQNQIRSGDTTVRDVTIVRQEIGNYMDLYVCVYCVVAIM